MRSSTSASRSPSAPADPETGRRPLAVLRGALRVVGAVAAALLDAEAHGPRRRASRPTRSPTSPLSRTDGHTASRRRRSRGDVTGDAQQPAAERLWILQRVELLPRSEQRILRDVEHAAASFVTRYARSWTRSNHRSYSCPTRRDHRRTLARRALRLHDARQLGSRPSIEEHCSTGTTLFPPGGSPPPPAAYRPGTKPRTSFASSSGFSRGNQWAAPSMTSRRASGISAAYVSAYASGAEGVRHAHDDERGRGDSPQPAAQLRVVQVRVPAELRRRAERLPHRAGRARPGSPSACPRRRRTRPSRASPRRPGALVGEEHLGELAGVRPNISAIGASSRWSPTGFTSTSLRHVLRVPGRELERHPPAEREPEDRRRVEAEDLPQVEQVEDGVLHAVDLVDALGLPEPGEHRHDARRSRRRAARARRAHALAARGVQVHERGPLPGRGTAGSCRSARRRLGRYDARRRRSTATCRLGRAQRRTAGAAAARANSRPSGNSRQHGMTSREELEVLAR